MQYFTTYSWDADQDIKALLDIPRIECDNIWLDGYETHMLFPLKFVLLYVFWSAIRKIISENKYCSSTTNAVNCLSAFLAAQFLTAGHTGTRHHFSKPLR